MKRRESLLAALFLIFSLLLVDSVLAMDTNYSVESSVVIEQKLVNSITGGFVEGDTQPVERQTLSSRRLHIDFEEEKNNGIGHIFFVFMLFLFFCSFWFISIYHEGELLSTLLSKVKLILDRIDNMVKRVKLFFGKKSN